MKLICVEDLDSLGRSYQSFVPLLVRDFIRLVYSPPSKLTEHRLLIPHRITEFPMSTPFLGSLQATPTPARRSSVHYEVPWTGGLDTTEVKSPQLCLHCSYARTLNSQGHRFPVCGAGRSDRTARRDLEPQTDGTMVWTWYPSFVQHTLRMMPGGLRRETGRLTWWERCMAQQGARLMNDQGIETSQAIEENLMRAKGEELAGRLSGPSEVEASETSHQTNVVVGSG